MKKFLRAIVAALLAAVMVLGCTSAFAAESRGKLLWNYYGWEYSYDYAGELSTGENKITTPDDSYYCYYVFNAEESGYYTMGFTDYAYDSWLGVPESVSENTAYNEADCIYHNTDNNFRRFTLKLNKGENIIGFDLNRKISNKTFEIVYEGSEINSVTIGKSLLYGCEIYSYGEFCEISTDIVIAFSSGTEITVGYAEGTVTKDMEKGTNTVSLQLFGETIDLAVDVYFITDIVKNVEISNIEDYLNAKLYYNGYEGYYPSGETFTFTFADGSTHSIIYSAEEDNFVTLPDSTRVFMYLTTEKNDDNEVTLNVMIADTVIRSYECSETKTSANENFASLAANGKYYADRVSRYLRYSAIALLECGSLGEIIDYGAEDSLYYIRRSAESFADIFREIFAFIAFLL